MDNNIHRIEYQIRNLGTRSLTLFPTRAQVFRGIESIRLEPGINEITVLGLSPTVDENSIKVEGSGSAIITDIAVESLPNRDSYDEVYPDEDSDSSDEEDDEIAGLENAQLDLLNDRLAGLEDEQERSREAGDSAIKRLHILDQYAKSINRENEGHIGQMLAKYEEERQSAFQDLMNNKPPKRTLDDSLDKLRAEIAKEQHRHDRAVAKAGKEQIKAKIAKEKRKIDRRHEKQRIRQERLAFWPKFCYSVRITLDCSTYTPASSRRGSVASEAELVKAPSAKDSSQPMSCDLLLSYVTTSAYWAPSYDLQLSTTSATGTLCFDAKLNNSTSETWSKCKVSLSTSETTFGGLDDNIPGLVPWQMRLLPKQDHSPRAGAGMLHSAEEANEQMQFQLRVHNTKVPRPRNEMFGVPDDQGLVSFSGQLLRDDYQAQLVLLEQQNRKRMMAAKEELQYVVPQYKMSAAPPAPPPMMPRGRAARQEATSGEGVVLNVAHASEMLMPETSYDIDEAATLGPEAASTLDFQESLVEETGLTTAYDLPGSKTLEPRTTASKQRVARITFTNVAYSHITVAKYKPVTYLKAKLRNTSKLSLLSGEAGLGLDGSFIGRTRLPRCSAGDAFSLSLGVDPAIKVRYPKPSVRRATTGTFSKESSSVYTRTVTVHNTRAAAGRPVQLVVLDQIPVSEDERLRVGPIFPLQLSTTGVSVSAGAPGRGDAEDRGWGKARAAMKKDGEVSWDVSLNAGKAVKLTLEYVVSMPSGEIAGQVGGVVCGCA